MESERYLANMENEIYLEWLQGYSTYRFHNLSLLKKALTAPGAEGKKGGTRDEVDSYEGNRKLAPTGFSLIPLAARQKALYDEDASPRTANIVIQTAISRKHQAERAKYLDLHNHLKLNIRSCGVAGPNTLCLAMCAILGAVWQDCGGDLLTVGHVLERLFIGVENESGVNPSLIFQGDLATADEFVADVVLGNDTNDTGSEATLPLSSSPTNNSVTADLLSLEIHVQESYRGSSISPRVSVQGTFLRETDHHELSVTGAGNISQQSQGSIDVPDYQYSNYDMDDIPWGSPSGSQNLTAIASPYGFSGSNSSFLEAHTYGEITPRSSSSDFAQSVQQTSLSDIGGSSQGILESIESPLQSRPASIEEIETHNLNEVPNAPNSVTSSKKRKSAPSRIASHQSRSTILEEYILVEKTRCESAGLPSSEIGLNLAIRQAFNVPLISDDMITSLKTLYYGIGCPESLVGLRDLLRAQRRLFAGKEVIREYNLSPPERMKAIDRLNDEIAYNNFLKRCHAYQLFVDCSAGSQWTPDGFVINTSQSVATRTSPQTGNPSYLEGARITELIMSKAYPGFVPNTMEYKKQWRCVTQLRKLGGRLHLLVENFGYGVLGLLPAPADELTGLLVLNITNTLILSFTDNTFRNFVAHLDRTLGNVLRALSDAVSGIVQVIFRGELDESVRFNIEHLEQAEIIEHPRGSPELLRLISLIPELHRYI